MRISDSTIREIRQRADIVSEIGLRVPLRTAGKDSVGLCPFHTEKTPSFSVNSAKQFFHCFGCGKTGDVFQFLQDHDGMTFSEAAKDLAGRLGIKIDQEQDAEAERKNLARQRERSGLESACQAAAQFYQQTLATSKDAQGYVAARGLSPEIIARFGVGYAPTGYEPQPLAKCFDDYNTSLSIVSAGLVVEKSEDQPRRDRFKDRLIFPIRDVRGRCVGFGGRTIRATSPNIPKYLNSPETPIFEKRKLLFGLNEARPAIIKAKQALVAEGYMDVVIMAQMGIENSVAALGTAINADHLTQLLRFTDSVCFVLDGDDAGQAAAWKALIIALPLLEPQHSLQFVLLPDKLDPDEFLQQHGAHAFRTLVQSAPTLTQYLIRGLIAQFGVDGALPSAEAKTRFMLEGERLCGQINVANPLRELLLQELDAATGRAPRAATQMFSAPSVQERLSRLANGGSVWQAPLKKKTEWLSREEWLARRASGTLPDSRPAAATRPAITAGQHKRSLWIRLTDAVSLAPNAARRNAQKLLALVDEGAQEEMHFAEALRSSAGDSTLKPEDEQAAADLLEKADAVIMTARRSGYLEELKTLSRAGQMSEDEYLMSVAQLG